MIVEMVAREIREHRDSKAGSFHAALVQGMRRHFQRHGPNVAVDERAQYALQGNRAGRGQAISSVEGHAFTADEDAQRANAGAPCLLLVQQVPEHSDRRALAVGAGHRDEAQHAAGLVVKRRRRDCGRASRVEHDHERQPAFRSRRFVLGNDKVGACLGRGTEKGISVARYALHGDECAALGHMAAVVADS